MAAAAKDMSKFYDAMLSFPGMNEKVKVGTKISRTSVLLLTLIIEQGLKLENAEKFSEILTAIPEDTKQELIELFRELLGKADLVALHDKLSTL